MFEVSNQQFDCDSEYQTFQSLESFSPNSNTQSRQEALATRLDADRARHLRYLRSRLPSSEDAEDALQDATLKFLQNAETLAAAEKPEAWVGVSLRRMVVDRYRRGAAQRRMASAFAAEPRETAEPEEDDTVTPIECLKHELHGLKPEYTEILRQVYLEDAPLKAVAERMDLTANNAAVRLHRARQALRDVMTARCGDCPLVDCWGRQRLAASAPRPALNLKSRIQSLAAAA